MNNVEDDPAAGGGDDGESQDFPQAPPPPPVSAYDELVARLLEFVCHSNAGAGLSEADRRTLLELLTASRECGRLNAKMHPKTTAQLDGLLDEYGDATVASALVELRARLAPDALAHRQPVGWPLQF